MKKRSVIKAVVVALCAIGMLLTTNWSAVAAAPSCSFTYTLNGGIITLIPTITEATHYQWRFVEDTGAIGYTVWTPIRDIHNHILGYKYPTTVRVFLSAKNVSSNQYVNYSAVVTTYKASSSRPTLEVDEPADEPMNIFRNITIFVGEWMSDLNILEFILIGVVAIIPVAVIVKKWPRKYVVYPILKKEKK